MLNVVVLIAVLGTLLYYQYRENPATLGGIVAVLVAAVVVEVVYRYGRKRVIHPAGVVD
jgi:hypothetical protein